ncbi:hypothetical protein ABT69_22605 [Salmonella enterica subsp. enterica serovar Typhimurium]|nr:hypothetical protein ABT69_22605 [Salmonella enterica subsp. enterica serovar Typhimurium]
MQKKKLISIAIALTHVAPPDDSGDDDVTPPDDSGDDDDTPPDDSVITFSNGVTIDKGKDTLTFDSFKLDNGSVLEGAVWNYSEQDNQWQLTTADMSPRPMIAAMTM